MKGATTVQLRQGINTLTPATVDADGSFSFPPLAPGIYTLKFIMGSTFAPAISSQFSALSTGPRAVTVTAGGVPNVQNLGVLRGVWHSLAVQIACAMAY